MRTITVRVPVPGWRAVASWALTIFIGVCLLTAAELVAAIWPTYLAAIYFVAGSIYGGRLSR